MFKQIILLLFFALITVNASLRIRRQFGSERGYHRRGGPSYRPSFGGNGYGGRGGGGFNRDNFGQGDFAGGHRHGGNKVVITEFIRGK